MPFLELTLDLQGLAPDVAEAATFDSGALSVTLTDSRDDAVLEPAPGEIRLWPATRLQALFPDGTDSRTCRGLPGAAARRGSDPHPATGRRGSALGARVAQGLPRHAFGARLWVCPRHEVVTDPASGRGVAGPGSGVRHRYPRDDRDVPELA